MPEMQWSRDAARGWFKPHNGPYGAPRGNRVLASKRITGPSAERIMRERIALEQCDHPGCEERAVIARDVTASVSTIKRSCMAHAATTSKQSQNVRELLKFPWQ